MFEDKPQFQYDYIKAYCKAAKYNCFMPVEYEYLDGQYRKKQMVCRLVKEGSCKDFTSCEHFQTAPEVPAEGTYLQKEPYK